MAKKHKIPYYITKLLLSAAILQLMLICFVMIPPNDTYSVFSAELRAYIPEMTQYAALTAALSLPVGIMTENIYKIIKK